MQSIPIGIRGEFLDKKDDGVDYYEVLDELD
jgi:hypothetical protein